MDQSAELLTELERIQNEYGRREREIAPGFYGWSRHVNQFLFFQLARTLIGELQRAQLFPVQGLRIADIGCGAGSWLIEFSQWGAEAKDLHGLDMNPARLEQ